VYRRNMVCVRYIVVHTSNNITCVVHCNYRVAATLCTVETPCKGGGDDHNTWSRDSGVNIVTRLRAGRIGVRITAGERDLSLLQKRPNRLWGPLSHLYNGYRSSFPGV
jgi:hypothetical protein